MLNFLPDPDEEPTQPDSDPGDQHGLIPSYIPSGRGAPGGGGVLPEIRIGSFEGAPGLITGQVTGIPASPDPAVLIAPSDPRRRTIILVNQGAGDLYYGGREVTILIGFRRGIGESLTLETTAEIYAIGTAAAGVVHWIAELNE